MYLKIANNKLYDLKINHLYLIFWGETVYTRSLLHDLQHYCQKIMAN